MLPRPCNAACDAVGGAQGLDGGHHVLARRDPGDEAAAGAAARQLEQGEGGLGVGLRDEACVPRPHPRHRGVGGHDAFERQQMPHRHRRAARLPQPVSMQKRRPVAHPHAGRGTEDQCVLQRVGVRIPRRMEPVGGERRQHIAQRRATHAVQKHHPAPAACGGKHPRHARQHRLAGPEHPRHRLNPRPHRHRPLGRARPGMDHAPGFFPAQISRPGGHAGRRARSSAPPSGRGRRGHVPAP